MIYYYDDDCHEDHWKEGKFPSDEAAVEWGNKLRERYKPGSCIVYREGDPDFVTVREWKE